MDARQHVLAIAFALEVEAQVRCGQARDDALYDHALREATLTADGFVEALKRRELQAHEEIDAASR